MIFFFFNDTATTEIYTLSLHDALPICVCGTGLGAKSATGRNGSRARRQPGGPVCRAAIWPGQVGGVPGRRCFCPSFTARKLREYGGRGGCIGDARDCDRTVRGRADPERT